MHPRAAELIYRTLLRVEARLARQALGMDGVPSMPADLVEPVAEHQDEAEQVAEPAPQAVAPVRPRFVEHIENMAKRGWTPQMVAHELRLHPKIVRQLARDHLITFHCQR